MGQKLGQGGYIVKNIFIALFCVLGHIDSHKHNHRIFYIFYILYPNMLRIQGGEHGKQQNISVWPKSHLNHLKTSLEPSLNPFGRPKHFKLI